MDIHTTRRDYGDIIKSATFEELLRVALRIVYRIPEPAGMVCGPITSGGSGSQRKNIARIAMAIAAFREDGANIFNQLVFEKAVMRIKETRYYCGEKHLLETFYRPIFESGRIAKLYFLSDWQSSFGANWEHDEALRLKIDVIYICPTCV